MNGIAIAVFVVGAVPCALFGQTLGYGLASVILRGRWSWWWQ